MNTIKATLYGKPMAQQRPRVTVQGGRAHVYQPKPSAEYRSLVQDALLRALEGHALPWVPVGSVSAEIYAYWPCPKSQYRKRKPRSQKPKTTRPDIDNIIKMILDAANGIVYRDDAQVIQVHATKFVAAQGEAQRVELVFKEGYEHKVDEALSEIYDNIKDAPDEDWLL